MSDELPAHQAAKPPRAHRRSAALVRAARDLGAYALALTVFAVTAHWTLNPVAAGYADKLFTLALVMIRLGNPPPPSPPTPNHSGAPAA